MAKENKYLQYAKSRKNRKIDIDLQQIALEYQKLLHKKFCYLFQGNTKVEFQFKMESFYHLLGLHKLSDVSVVKMIENYRMKKDDFFKYILEGKIALDRTDESIVDDEHLVNICDTKRVSDFGEIKAHRFAYFSEKNVLELLLSDPVIDFENSGCDSVIEADKIFFKLHRDKVRNLNLFIGFDQEKGNYFASTFFLEMVRDKYRLKENGDAQPVLYILSRLVVNTMNNRIEDFVIKWENVRKELSFSPYYRAQSRLRTWISNRHIKSSGVGQEIEIQRKLLIAYRGQLKELQRQYSILNLIGSLRNEGEQREQAILELMDYGIDSDSEEELAPYSQMDMKCIGSDKNRIEDKTASLENKLKKFEQFLPELKLLEIEEVIYAYQPYLSNMKLDQKAVSKMIEEYDIYANALLPADFRKVYYGRKAYAEAAATINE